MSSNTTYPNTAASQINFCIYIFNTSSIIANYAPCITTRTINNFYLTNYTINLPKTEFPMRAGLPYRSAMVLML